MARALCLPLLCAPVILCVACSGDTQGTEWGAACSDAKDNDADSLIDCADPDCRAMPICGGRPDGAPDRAADLRRDSLVADKVAPREPAVLPGYGSLCTSPLDLCPDQKTICVPGVGSPQGTGYCTYPCTGGSASCPAAQAGQVAACVYAFNGKSYCAFLCKYTGRDYLCPSGMGCFEANPPQPYQKYCWPR